MKMYIVNLTSPFLRIKVAECVVKECPKSKWAIAPSGRRFKVGFSAFDTIEEADAQRARKLDMMVKDRGTKTFRPHLWKQANDELQKYKVLSTLGS